MEEADIAFKKAGSQIKIELNDILAYEKQQKKNRKEQPKFFKSTSTWT